MAPRSARPISVRAWRSPSTSRSRRSESPLPSPPFRGEREGPIAQRWEGEVGVGERTGIPHLTPTLSAPGGGEGGAGRQPKHLSLPPLERARRALFGEGAGGFLEILGEIELERRRDELRLAGDALQIP